MGFLPRRVILLDDNLASRSALTRLGESDVIGGRSLKERDYDELIVTHQEVIADALREAGLIGADSGLLHLGRILGIDVLFAEVEGATGAFRRFVVVEDKLCRNPEARREVLGQILDYSRALKGIGPDRLSELLSDHSPWVDANEDLIGSALRHGDFLLLVCADEIPRRLIEYVDHLKNQLDPLTAADLALMSIAVFSNGTDHILLPHVVGAMVKAERPLTIKVVVTDSGGTTLGASASVESPARQELDSSREKINRSELLAALGKPGNQSRETAEKLLTWAMGIGAEISFRAAAASVRVRNVVTDRPCTLFVITRRGTFYIGFLRRWEENASVGPDVGRQYESALPPYG